MSQHLLLVCNSRSATITTHKVDLARRTVLLCRQVRLPVPVGENSASPMLLSADGRMLYLAWRGAEKQLMSFAQSSEPGDFELIGTLPLTDDICYLGFDAAGHRLLAAAGDDALSIPLGSDGLPVAVQQRVPVGLFAHSIVAIAPDRVLAAAWRGNLLRSFSYDLATGHLAAMADLPQPAGSGPRHMCVAKDGRHVYVVTQESGEVVTLKTSPDLTEIQRVPLVDDLDSNFTPMGGEIAITPDGRFLYATERSSNRLIGYAINPETGRLRRLDWVSVPDYPRAFAIDGSGRFLTVLGFRGHRAAIFAISTDGALEAVADFTTGERPSWVLSIPCP